MPTSPSSPTLTGLDEPLGDAELDALTDDIEAAGKDFDWTTGFLTALVTGPELVPPNEWIPVVFGRDSFADIEDAKGKLGRVMRWYNEVASTLRGGEETICPTPSDHAGLELFCEGYLAGTRRHPQWLSDERAIVLLFPMGVLSGEFDLSDALDENDRPIDDPEAHKQKYRENLDSYIHTLYEYWSGARIVPATQPKAPKVGRNDPCPCGSGKKAQEVLPAVTG